MPRSRLILALAVAFCALLTAATPTTASPGGLKVLVTGNCAAETAPMATAMQAQSGVASVTTFDTNAATPTLSQLATQDLVVDTGDTCGNGYSNSVTYGNNLADYVDQGGVVLQAAFDNFDEVGSHPTGRFASGGYAPLSLGPNGNNQTTLGQVLKPHSPIVQGLGTFSTGSNTTTPLAPGATLLAKWADGRNAIAVKGRVVATSASADDSSARPDLARLASNTGAYFNAVPDTKITKAIIHSGAHTAAFTFKPVGPYSMGFRCALKKAKKKAAFTSCPSHKKYAHLAPGRYTFEVAAVGPGGADPSPAKKTFRISP
jgi:hypothetical protein